MTSGAERSSPVHRGHGRGLVAYQLRGALMGDPENLTNVADGQMLISKGARSCSRLFRGLSVCALALLPEASSRVDVPSGRGREMQVEVNLDRGLILASDEGDCLSDLVCLRQACNLADRSRCIVGLQDPPLSCSFCRYSVEAQRHHPFPNSLAN